LHLIIPLLLLLLCSIGVCPSSSSRWLVGFLCPLVQQHLLLQGQDLGLQAIQVLQQLLVLLTLLLLLLLPLLLLLLLLLLSLLLLLLQQQLLLLGSWRQHLLHQQLRWPT
jgi:hypothetical protein